MIKKTVCFESPCHLKCANGQMIVAYSHVKGMEDREDRSLPIEDLGIVLLEHPQITLSHFLLNKLVENNTAVVICNETHHPAGLLLTLEGNTLQSERFRAQVEASEPLKKQIWQQVIKAKINNQAAVLKAWGIPHKQLEMLSASVKSGDGDNCEATAAAYYWHNLFPPAWNFFRKRDGLPPNNLLNYGYAIIRAGMARALIGAGLLPAFGVFHRSRYNAYCLADDIMEPYRPYVDKIVRTIIDETSNVNELNKDIKTRLLQIPTTDVTLNGEKSPLMLAMQRTAASLAKCYMEETKKILLPSF